MTSPTINNIDVYKADHASQYPKGTTRVFSNWTGRKSRIEGIDYTVHFGLQYLIQRYLIKEMNETFFEVPKEQAIRKYKRRLDGMGIVIDYSRWEALHDLGYLPLEIWSLPEGTRVSIRVPSYVMWNTHDDFYWVTNYFETLASCVVWLPTTSATQADHLRGILEEAMAEAGGPEEFVDWQGHDFSMRGMAGPEAAAMSGAGHLLSFTGTDTIPAIDFLEDYYGADCEQELVGGSVPATEHSVMCSGSQDGEFDTFKTLITETYPTGMVSIVSDTWDFWQVIDDFLPRLKDDIMARDGKVVIRPDSGDPVEIICGKEYRTYSDLTQAIGCEEASMYQEAEDDCEGSHSCGLDSYTRVCRVGDKFYRITAEFEYNRWDKTYYYVDNYRTREDRVRVEEITPDSPFTGAWERLWQTFGGTVNKAGFKVLDPHIGLIYGDSITRERAREISRRLIAKGFCPLQVLGIGSFTYQYVTRDTFGFAMKATYVEINGEGRAIFKDPKTDSGEKKSAKGLLAVYRNEEGELYLKEEATWEEVMNCEFDCVFSDGTHFNPQTLTSIRNRLRG